MRTVLLKAHIDDVRSHIDEHLPGAMLRYNKTKRMTAVQHPELSELEVGEIENIARVHALPYVCCVNLRPFSRSA